MADRIPLVIDESGNPSELTNADILQIPAADIGGALVIGGGLSFKIEPLITTSYVITTESFLEAQMIDNAQIITLPSAASRYDGVDNIGDVIVIKNSKTTGSFKIAPDGIDTIDGAAGQIKIGAGDAIWFLAKSTDWLLI